MFGRDVTFPHLVQVLKNDVLAHQATVETVNKAGNELLESSAGDDASSLRNRLEKLNSCWESVLQKTEEREQQLQSTLQQVSKRHWEYPALCSGVPLFPFVLGRNKGGKELGRHWDFFNGSFSVVQCLPRSAVGTRHTCGLWTHHVSPS